MLGFLPQYRPKPTANRPIEPSNAVQRGPILPFAASGKASTPPSMLASSAAARQLVRATQTRALPVSTASMVLAVQRRSYATPMGPPPKNFRLKPQPEWDQEKEGTFERAGKYFLMTEMARGMYVLMEQFFRPP